MHLEFPSTPSPLPSLRGTAGSDPFNLKSRQNIVIEIFVKLFNKFFFNISNLRKNYNRKMNNITKNVVENGQPFHNLPHFKGSFFEGKVAPILTSFFGV